MYGKPGGAGVGTGALLPATGIGFNAGVLLAIGVLLLVSGALLIRRASLSRTR